MKRIGLLLILLFIGTVAWSLNIRTITDQALRYLGQPLPKNTEAVEDMEGGRIITVREGDYMEMFFLATGQDGKVQTVYFYVFDKDRKKVEQGLEELQSMVYLLGLSRSPLLRGWYTDSTNSRDVFAHMFTFSPIEQDEKYFAFVMITTVMEIMRQGGL
jgi:hypothetical protein